MTKKKKTIGGLIVVVLVLLLLSEGRRVTFAFECIAAESDHASHYAEREDDFLAFAAFVENTQAFEFDFHSPDTIYLNFRDTSNSEVYLGDHSYMIRPDSITAFSVDENGCLEVIDSDTTKVCDEYWSVGFYGNYKSNKIDALLGYSGWSRADFNKLVEAVQNLGCSSYKKYDNGVVLRHEIVSFYRDGGLHCFGHGDGYFEYLHTARPDSFLWRADLKELGEKYYSLEYWEF